MSYKTLIKNQMLKVMTVMSNIDEKQNSQGWKQFKKQYFYHIFYHIFSITT